MSTAAVAIGGRERRSLYWLWITLLVVGFLVLLANFYLANRFTTDESNARNRVTDIQVLSQKIAKFAQGAGAGNLDEFDELQATRDDIQRNIDILVNGGPEGGEDQIPAYADVEGVAAELKRLREIWQPLNESAGKILQRREMTLDLFDTAGAFAASLPQLQQQMDEAVRALVEGGASSSQIYTASSQNLLADRMLRRVTLILQGGTGALSAADALSREVTLYGQTLNALTNGASELNIRRVDIPAARNKLVELEEMFQNIQSDVEGILQSSTDLFEVKEAADDIFLASEDLLRGAQSLNAAFGKLPEARPFPSVTAGLTGGALALVGIFGLLITLYRDQAKRFQVTQELNQRNQEAILRLLDEMGSLAEGDLTVRATVTEDITGAIADSINFAIEALRSLVTTINETAVQVAAAAQETQATAMHLAEAAEHQAQQITSASAAINEIAVSIDEVSKNSAESADVAQRSVQIAAKGAEVVRQTIQGMDSIRDQIQETSKRIKRLGESSQEIGSIVELINDIAEQTNILALNAAIQAASAGEAGRGFAVVADEVQRLAERASNATKRIETLVQTIQADTNEAVSSMEQTTAEVVAGARLAEDAGLALGEIEKVSNDLADLIQNISEAARQQSAAATNISATMNVIQEITSQTSMGASQTAESIGNLAQLAADLRRSVADFKLPG
ncbi:methyl-accepting chemotaxis protein [Pseudomarimonas arenosa]|uniref:Methyl-accepting chemotaxis protein n=1 Tax=Pseudomarimonas arenosa TaxID=2774145 RepID=A0AAW3ZHU2_9GAMM|nr:methyl-accepting chemotaxis protein [Pseudomarimonas arenosa]MBD8525568.1 methyl-accepting chemotaxis protein [Pseudomarimonas arenosa]